MLHARVLHPQVRQHFAPELREFHILKCVLHSTVSLGQARECPAELIDCSCQIHAALHTAQLYPPVCVGAAAVDLETQMGPQQ